MMEAFIPTELAVAPNPLGPTDNLRLTTIPIDAHIRFEFWKPPLDSVLLPEEAMLLAGDRLRLEEICAKLVWLLGATVINGDSSAGPAIEHNWQRITGWVKDAGEHFDALSLTYHPQTLSPYPMDEDVIPTAWAMKPPTWQISFLELHSVDQRIRVAALPICVSMSLGQTVVRDVKPVPLKSLI